MIAWHVHPAAALHRLLADHPASARRGCSVLPRPGRRVSTVTWTSRCSWTTHWTSPPASAPDHSPRGCLRQRPIDQVIDLNGVGSRFARADPAARQAHPGQRRGLRRADPPPHPRQRDFMPHTSIACCAKESRHGQSDRRTQAGLPGALPGLHAKAPSDVTQLRADIDLQDVLVLNLSRAVQLCVDMAAHVIAGQAWPPPNTMGEALTVLPAWTDPGGPGAATEAGGRLPQCRRARLRHPRLGHRSRSAPATWAISRHSRG